MVQVDSEVRIKEVEPLRNMGFWVIWAAGVGAVIGDGIFLLLGQGIQVAGPSAAIAFLVAGLIQMSMMIGLGEMAVAMPAAGAMTVWVERFMGKWWGFFAGFAYAFGWVITGGSIGLAIGRFTCWFFPSLDVETWTIIFAIFWLTVLAVMNIVGTAIAAKAQLALVLILVGIMALFGILGMTHIDPANYKPFMPFGFAGFAAALPLGTYAYMGAITIATTGSECKKPKDLGKAIVWSGITFLVIYTIDQLVVEGIIPWQQVGMEASPFTTAAESIFGYYGGLILNIAAWIAAFTSLLMGTFYSASRIFYQSAIEGYMPKFFGYLHPKTRTPIWGIIAIYIFSVVACIIGIANPDFLYVTLSTQVVVAWILSWGLALVCGVMFKTKHKDEIEKAGWKQPLFPLFPVIGLGGCAYVLYLSFQGESGLPTLIAAAVWIGLLAIYYFFIVKKRVAA